MKKVKFFAMALAAMTMAFGINSCTKDEDKGDATISFTATSPYTLQEGSVIAGTVVASQSDATIESINIVVESKKTDGSTTTGTIASIGSKLIVKVTDAHYTFTIGYADIMAKVAQGSTPTGIRVTTAVKDGSETSKTLTFKTGNDPVEGGEINTFAAKLLGAQDASTGSFLASIDGTVYSQAQAIANVAKIDISYGVIGGSSSFVSPSTRGTLGFTAVTGGTITKFVKTTITATAFAAITDDTDFASLSATATDVRGIAKDEVYFFQNAAGKKGIMLITDLKAGNSGSVTVTVKVQK